MNPDAEEWLKRLRTGEEHVVPSPLHRAMTFLLDARNPDEGWAEYLHLPTNLQVTAEAITALRFFRRSAADVAAANAAVWVRRTHGSRETAEDLIALLAVAGTEGQPDGAYADRLSGNLAERITEVSTVLLARALLAAETQPETARPWLEELLARQRGDGSWQSARRADEAIPVTAWAVRALAAWRALPDAARAADRGLAYLRLILRERGWASPALANTYVLAIVTRALATGSGDPELSEEGLNRLRRRQRPDGGWGAGPGEPPSAEQTAAAVIAFAECGAFQYVPLRSARQAVSELTAAQAELARRHESLESDMDARVEERAAYILADRDRLQRRVNELQKDVDGLRGLISAANVDPPETKVHRGTIYTTLLSVALSVGAAATTGLIANRSGKQSWLVTSVYIGALVITIVTAVGVYLVRPGLASIESGLAGSRLVDAFMTASEPLTARERQDVAYELIREGAELPADYARRFFQEWFYRRELDPSVAQALRRWIEDYVGADEGTRKEFLSRLRKTVA